MFKFDVLRRLDWFCQPPSGSPFVVEVLSICARPPPGVRSGLVGRNPAGNSRRGPLTAKGLERAWERLRGTTGMAGGSVRWKPRFLLPGNPSPAARSRAQYFVCLVRFSFSPVVAIGCRGSNLVEGHPRYKISISLKGAAWRLSPFFLGCVPFRLLRRRSCISSWSYRPAVPLRTSSL